MKSYFWIIRFLAIKRPTAVAMFALAVVFAGLAAVTRLPLDLTPYISFPKLLVVTYCPKSRRPLSRT